MDNSIRVIMHRVFPARAGMIPPPMPWSRFRTGIPRESGDDPKFFVVADTLYEYSPRERG